MGVIRWIVVAMMLVAGAGLAVSIPAWSAEKVIQTQKSRDLVITLKSESGQWTPGKNTFALEFTSAKDQ